MYKSHTLRRAGTHTHTHALVYVRMIKPHKLVVIEPNMEQSSTES